MLPAALIGAVLLAGIALGRQMARVARSTAGRVVGWSVAVVSGLGLLVVLAFIVIVWMGPMH
jgi:hypothetical protein